MGSDDLFHKRKAKGLKDLARKKSKRDAYEKILIVCEGSKTEPYYFKDARSYHKLNTLNIEVKGLGKDPLSLVNFAKQLYREEERLGDAYDWVYCVFDKDQHTTYQDAIEQISALSNKNWVAINSVPCFEYWLLLHFIYSTQPFYAIDGLSASQAVERELKKYIPDYEKSTKQLYRQLIEQIPMAINYAKRSFTEAVKNKTDNPSTNIYQLIEHIQGIKNNP